MKAFRAIFFGTPEIAVPALRALADVADVAAVVCQPDKPVGRVSTPKAPAVKEAALALGIAVHQPTKVRVPEFAQWVASLEADVAVVLAYGRILTSSVLAAPRKGCINLHASLLPALRGAAPITWTVVRGDRETGISVMQMDEGLDTGPVYLARTLAIGPDETAGELSVRMAELAAQVIRDDLRDVVAGRFAASPQDPAKATLAPILSKENGRIAWADSAQRVHDHVRGMSPWPGAFSSLRGKTLKVLSTRRVDAASPTSDVAGRVSVVEKRRVFVRCGEGHVEVLRAQVEGRKALDAAELLAGRAIVDGDHLGEGVVAATP